MMKKWLLVLGVIGLACVLAAGYFWQRRAPELQYLAEAAVIGDIENTVIAGGQVYAEELVDVGAQATGRVERLHVELGQKVKKGDPVADIESTQQENALKDEEASHKMLAAQYDIKKIQLSQARDDFHRQKQAYRAGVLSKADYQRAQTALAAAEKEMAVNQAQLEQARLKIATAKANLAYTRITAPIDGVVVSIVTKQGQNINAAQSSPTIIKLAQIDTVQIKAKFSEADIPKLKAGMRAYFSILGLPQRFEATLDALELAPAGEGGGSPPSAVYYYGLLTVPNLDHRLYIGMSANVTVLIEKKAQVLTIPVTALGRQVAEGEFEVQVMEGGAKRPAVRTRTVKIGMSNNIRAEVLSGLEEGEQVVVSSSDGKVEALGAEEIGL